jgi:hypothetical protein
MWTQASGSWTFVVIELIRMAAPVIAVLGLGVWGAIEAHRGRPAHHVPTRLLGG